MSKLYLPLITIPLSLIFFGSGMASAAPLPEVKVVKTIAVAGFDPEGEPEIRLMSNGSLLVVFNLMPPSYIDPGDSDLGPFKGFDKEMERAIGVPVVWEDREVLLIQKPRADTAERVKGFLEKYRKNKGR
jgi:hypothetical protein